MPGLVHDLDTDDEMPGLIDDDGYNEHSHLMNIYGDFHNYKEYEYDCEENLPDVDSDLEVDEGDVQAKEDVVVQAKEDVVVQAKEDVVVQAKEDVVVQAKEDVVVQAKENVEEVVEKLKEAKAKEELVLEDSEAKELKELKEDIMNLNLSKDVVIEIKELEPTLEPPMDREIKQPSLFFCIIC
jgi:hypothetical protein